MTYRSIDNKTYTIKRFVFGEEYGPEGGHAKAVKFMYRDRTSNREKEMSIYEYFQMKYNIHLNYWYLPLIETERDGKFPMEVCVLLPNQRYAFKLDSEQVRDIEINVPGGALLLICLQTAKMIKFAVTRPKDRMAHINFGINMLKWHEDPYLNAYGIKVEPQMSIVSRLPPLEFLSTDYLEDKCKTPTKSEGPL